MGPELSPRRGSMRNLSRGCLRNRRLQLRRLATPASSASSKSEKTASNKVAHEVIVGVQLSNKDHCNADRVDGAEACPHDPKDRHNCADGDHVTGWKSSETRASVKWIEVVDAISDERGTVLHPGLGPCTTEGKLEPILGRIRNS